MDEQTSIDRNPITPEQLDRLVDGALAEADRRVLLTRIAAEPNGWRRCALAFLEAQAWRSAIGSLAEVVPLEVEAVPPPRRHRSLRRIVPMTLAAGIALAAFLLGRSTVSPEPRPDDDRLAGRSTSAVNLESGTGDQAPENEPVVPEQPLTAIGYLDLPTANEPGAPVVQLPVLFGPGLDDRWLRDQPPFVPDRVRLDWERRGYDFELQRRLVSVQIDDSGRYVTIPVDEVMLRSSPRELY